MSADLGGLGARPTETGSRASAKPASGLVPTGFDPARLHGDIKLMLLASPVDENSALMPTGLSMRETEFAMNSGAYRQVYRPKLKEFGYQLTAYGRRLRAAIATEAGTAETGNTGSVHEGAGRKASPNNIGETNDR